MKINQTGQGLLEALVATTIIVVGISGVISLSGNNLIASNISTGELLAINLSREAAEVITNIRDSNYLDDAAAWNTGLDTGTNDINGIIEYDNSTHTWSVNFIGLGTDLTDADTIMYFDANTGLYRQSENPLVSWTPTNYRRLVRLYRICDSNITNFITNGQCSGLTVGYRILVDVQWVDHGNVRLSTLEKRIFNWR